MVAEANGQEIFGQDIKTLFEPHPKNKLNDNIINFYFAMIQERSKQENHRSVFAFNHRFFTKLKKNGWEKVKRWSKNIELFSIDLILIPICWDFEGEGHWCLAAIDMEEKEILYFDSCGKDDRVSF